MSAGNSAFASWNLSIPFEIEQASKSFGELYMFAEAKTNISACAEPSNKAFLEKLLVIFGISRIKESFEQLSENLDRNQIKLMNELLLKLFNEIKYDAVLCLDGLLMEDEIIRSPFGSQKGNMYEQFLSRILAERENFGRAPYWREIVKARNGGSFDML